MTDSTPIEYNLDYMPKLRKRLVDCETCTGHGYVENSGVGMLKQETVMCTACNGLGSLMDAEVVLDNEAIKLYRSFQINTARFYVESLKNRNKSLLAAALIGPARVNEWVKNNRMAADRRSTTMTPATKNTRGPFRATLSLD